MSALVGLIRHAAHDELGRVLSGRASDIGLNAAGRAQLPGLAEALAGRGIMRLETSPRRRAQETAQVLGAGLELTPQIEPALDEIDFGEWAGRPFSELEGEAAWQQWNRARATATGAGGETMAAAVARAAGHLDALGAAGAGPVLCVSHGDIIRGVIAHYLGLSLDNMLRFEIDPASVSWIRVDGQGAAQILVVNGQG